MSYKIIKLLRSTSLPKGGRPHSEYVVREFYRAGSVTAVHETVFNKLKPSMYALYDGRKKDFTTDHIKLKDKEPKRSEPVKVESDKEDKEPKKEGE